MLTMVARLRAVSSLTASVVLAIFACTPSTVHSGIIQQVSVHQTVLVPGDVLCISFRLSLPAHVTVTVVDSDLVTVKTIDLGSLLAGEHVARWDGKDQQGNAAPPEVYTWTIEARTASGFYHWHPAELRARPVDFIRMSAWDSEKKMIYFDVPSAMRAWVRIALRAGACVSTPINGEVWMPGRIGMPWDGRDESGTVDVLQRTDWYVTAFGYRLPRPCVLIKPTSGGAPYPASRCIPPTIDPPVRPEEDPPWSWVRGSCLCDRIRPHPVLEQDAPHTYSFDLRVHGSTEPQSAAVTDRIRRPGVHLRWFIDGAPVAEAPNTALPASLTLSSDQVPHDSNRHFLTAAAQTATGELYTASIWMEAADAREQ